MGLKKVINLGRLRGINSRGAVEDVCSDKGSLRDAGVANSKDNEDLPVEMIPEKSLTELAIAVVSGETESIDSRFQVCTLPSRTMDESVKDEQSDAHEASFVENEPSVTLDKVIQVYEIVDFKNDDGSSNESLMGVPADETTAFEILSLNSATDYGSIFSGVLASDAGSVNKEQLSSSDDDTVACGSLITKTDEGDSESNRSTTALGPEIILFRKDQNSTKSHTLKKFFSLMSLIEGKHSVDETNGAIDSKATLDTNSLEASSFKSPSTFTDETANESESSSVAIAMFAERNTHEPSRTKSKVLAPSNAAGNREAKKKALSIIIDNFKQLAGKSACFCDNDTENQIVYGQSDVSIEGIFSRDVEDSESRISCALDHTDTFTLDSMGLNGNRMYM